MGTAYQKRLDAPDWNATMDKRNDLILEHLPRVEGYVRTFVRKYPALAPHTDDLIGTANLKLVEVVDRFLAGKIQSLPAYLRLSVMRAIVDFMRIESLIPVRSKNCPTIVFQNLDMLVAAGQPDGVDFGTLSALFDAIKDRKDAMIVQGRLEGSSLSTIAAGVGLTRQTVRARLARMKKRYEQKAQKNF